MKFSYLYISILSVLLLSSCEDVIEVDLDASQPQITVDAFLTNRSEIQTIDLKMSAPYFDNETKLPISDATVQLSWPETDGTTNTISFSEDQANPGTYQWDPNITLPPSAPDSLSAVGSTYTLRIETGDKTIIGQSLLNPVPAIDSIAWVREVENPADGEIWQAEFFATDFAGREDFYWIQFSKNGEFQGLPTDFTLSQDAAFSGAGADGFVFIAPIRESINIGDEPYEVGDSLDMTLKSITKDCWEFLTEVQVQSTNGGLFAAPIANVRTNLKFENEIQGELGPIGYFSISAVSAASSKLEE